MTKTTVRSLKATGLFLGIGTAVVLFLFVLTIPLIQYLLAILIPLTLLIIIIGSAWFGCYGFIKEMERKKEYENLEKNRS